MGCTLRIILGLQTGLNHQNKKEFVTLERRDFIEKAWGKRTPTYRLDKYIVSNTAVGYEHPLAYETYLEEHIARKRFEEIKQGFVG